MRASQLGSPVAMPARRSTSAAVWRAVGALGVVCAASADPGPPPSAHEQLRSAGEPLASGWFNEEALRRLAAPDAACQEVHIALDWVGLRVRETHDEVRGAAHHWQDSLIASAFEHLGHPYFFFRSRGFRALLQPAMDLHRLCQHAADFVGVLAVLHGERCFFPKLRDALGAGVVALTDVSSAVHRILLATVYKGMFSFWDESADVLRHVEPVWSVVANSAKVVDAWTVVRLRLHEFSTRSEEADDDREGGQSGWQDSRGAFSDMNYLQRKLTDGWHLDHGLVASLLRLWQPPEGWEQPGDDESSCHTSIADFGAGGGHYCALLNRTGEFCCHAFDGSPSADRLSEGRVSVARLDEPFDLGRTFDWVLCLEVAEHIPLAAQPALLGNLRRHAARGLVLSWSEESSKAHPNARPFQEVRRDIEDLGFVLDAAASRRLRPRIAWLRGAVHVFRLPGA